MGKYIFTSFAYATGLFTGNLSRMLESEELSKELSVKGFSKEKQAILYNILLELSKTFYVDDDK